MASFTRSPSAGHGHTRRSRQTTSAPLLHAPLPGHPWHINPCCWPACNRQPGRCVLGPVEASRIRCRSHAEAGQATKSQAAYQVLLTMVAKLHTLETTTTTAAAALPSSNSHDPQGSRNSLLDKFMAARPEVLSVPFLSWIADQEAAAPPGEMKQKLGDLCQRLVVAREVLEQERFEQLHANTLLALGQGPEGIAARTRISYTGASHSKQPQLQQPQQHQDQRQLLEPQQQQEQRYLLLEPAHATGTEDTAAATMAPTPIPGMQPSLHRHLQEDGTGLHLSSTHDTQGTPSDASPNPDSIPHPDQSSNPSQDSNLNSVSNQGAGVSGSSLAGAAGAAGGSLAFANGSAGGSLAELSDPVQYALRLSSAVTGRPPALSGFDPLYDAVIAAAAPAALSPEALAAAHKEADELQVDLAARRRRSVASILGRTKVTPEQAAQLMGGSAPARILDLLLSLPDIAERVALLPDCFIPPSKADEHSNCGPDADESDYDELWCTPSQLLSEISGRLKALSTTDASKTGGDEESGNGAMPFLAPVPGQLVGPELRNALVELRERVNAVWLDGLGQAHKDQKDSS